MRQKNNSKRFEKEKRKERRDEKKKKKKGKNWVFLLFLIDFFDSTKQGKKRKRDF